MHFLQCRWRGRPGSSVGSRLEAPFPPERRLGRSQELAAKPHQTPATIILSGHLTFELQTHFGGAHTEGVTPTVAELGTQLSSAPCLLEADKSGQLEPVPQMQEDSGSSPVAGFMLLSCSYFAFSCFHYAD